MSAVDEAIRLIDDGESGAARRMLSAFAADAAIPTPPAPDSRAAREFDLWWREAGAAIAATAKTPRAVAWAGWDARDEAWNATIKEALTQ